MDFPAFEGPPPLGGACEKQKVCAILTELVTPLALTATKYEIIARYAPVNHCQPWNSSYIQPCTLDPYHEPERFELQQ